MPPLPLPTKPVLICAILSPVILTACATTTPSAAPTDKVFCSVAQPIYWSKSDTDKTLAQIREHNAAYVAICGKPAPKPAPVKPAPTKSAGITFKDRWQWPVPAMLTH